MRPYAFRAAGFVLVDDKGMKAVQMAFDLTPIVNPMAPQIPAITVIDMVKNSEGDFVPAHA